MATIFYSVGGEGLGHATRSGVVISHLLRKHHTLCLFSHERAFSYLKETFGNSRNILKISEISGINFVYEDNQFMLGKTVLKEAKKLSSLLFKTPLLFIKSILLHRPDVVISDFEPASVLIAKAFGIPVIHIDNQAFMSKCSIDKRFSASPYIKLINYTYPLHSGYNLIPTMFNVPLKKRYAGKATLIGPFIRGTILKSKRKQGNHILVYQTSTSNRELFDVLKKSSEHYIVYGFNRLGHDKNLEFKKASERQFADDLASSKAIITNGGFTLMSEAIALKKPVYTIPVKNQIEQEVNGYYLQRSGFGMCSEEINLTDLNTFLKNISTYGKALSKLSLKINQFDILDNKLDSLTTNPKKQADKRGALDKKYVLEVN